MSASAHAAEEPDEATRILQASDAIAPSGDVQAMQTARPADAAQEPTTILVHPAEEDDERTTILRGPDPPQAGAAGQNGEPAGGFAPFHPPADYDHTSPAPAEPWAPDTDDEATTILTGLAQASTQPESAGEDEATFILTSQAPRDTDAPSAVLPPHLAVTVHAAPGGAAASPLPDPGPETSPQAGPQDTTAILPAPEPPATADSTEILPASALGDLPDTPGDADGQVSGRAWFDRRLRDFNHALLHTQDGQRRPSAERQALAAAARDMIQRVALRDPEHRPAEWADTVLQADQLLVNTYFVRALIARGGVGEIYRARHRDLKTEHAIKILLPRYALDPTVLNLMLEEARLLQRVRHEAVVGCQGLLRDTDGRPMLVMDYLRGRTLSARLRQGPLPQAELIRLAARLASGLIALHAQGLVHQDISPDNIILVDDNCAAATIIDFGLARSLDAPENTHRNIDFAGKFSWCSPEQLSSRAVHVDARSDLYSLGLVLAASARGTRLDMGSDLTSARAARHSVPPLDGIQEPIATLLRHLLAPSTATRLRSAEEVPDWLRPRRPGFVQRMFGR